MLQDLAAYLSHVNVRALVQYLPFGNAAVVIGQSAICIALQQGKLHRSRAPADLVRRKALPSFSSMALHCSSAPVAYRGKCDLSSGSTVVLLTQLPGRPKSPEAARDSYIAMIRPDLHDTASVCTRRPDSCWFASSTRLGESGLRASIVLTWQALAFVRTCVTQLHVLKYGGCDFCLLQR